MAGKRIVVFSLFGLVALALTVFASSGTEAGTYKVYLTYALSNYTAGNNADTLNDIKIPSPDLNYEDSSMLTFNPIDPSSVMGYKIPIGAGVGILNATSTVGISNGACNSSLLPNFKLYNASVDTSNVLGPTDMYFVLKDKVKVPVPKGKWDTNLADYLEGYPGFLNELFDPDGPHGPLPPLIPRSRYAGHDFVANMNILIQVVTFSPGQMAQLPGIYQQLGAAAGRPSFVILNNPISQEEAPGAISDFCTPLSTLTTTYGVTADNPDTPQDEGTPGGPLYVIQSNPAVNKGVLATGTHIARNYSRTERDADADGIENDLDPCPYTQDLGWQPRAICLHPGPGDHDCDGLPDSCDPTPEVSNVDQDGDGYNNRQDICSLVINGCKVATCEPFTFNPIWDNQADDDSAVGSADLGPMPDSIGNACDDSDCDGVEDAAVTPCSCADGINNGGGGDPTGLIDGNDPDCIPKMDKAEVGECRNSTDDDPVNDGAAYGTWINDGCPVKGAVSEASITGACNANNAVDDDADTRVNDGCPTKGAAEVAGVADGSEALIWGTNPGTGLFFHAMPLAAVCVGGTDTDLDGYCDSLEDLLGAATLKNNGSEYNLVKATVCGGALANCCDNALDDDSDGYVNDGCPKAGDYAETGAECANDTSNDTPTPDAIEQTQGVKINDGCPVIGVPESLVLDVVVTAGDAQPSNTVPQTCSDGIDNDGDTAVDTDNTSLGCNPAHTSYNNDADKDGKAGAADNCPTVWNPEQTNTDGGTVGDACDTDDDNDGFADAAEWTAGSDPLDANSTPEVCDGIDNDGDCPGNTNGDAVTCGCGTNWNPTPPAKNCDTGVDEGFTDSDGNGAADCYDDKQGASCLYDADLDTVCNANDINDDSWKIGSVWYQDKFDDSMENYLGTLKDVKCGTAGPPVIDADPFDPYVDGESGLYDNMLYFQAPQAYGTSLASDDQGYWRRLDVYVDYEVGLYDGMMYFEAPQAYGNMCTY